MGEALMDDDEMIDKIMETGICPVCNTKGGDKEFVESFIDRHVFRGDHG